MQVDTGEVVSRPATVRSAISNGSRLLAGVDGRSAPARRFRDLIADLINEHGGKGALSAAQLGVIRQAAAINLHLERLQAAIVRGAPVDSDTPRRILASLRKQRDRG